MLYNNTVRSLNTDTPRRWQQAVGITSRSAYIFRICTIRWWCTCLHKCLLPYYMVQSPSWEANWFAASQEIHRISRNPKVHYHTHKRPPPVSILGQPNPVHILTSHLLEIHPNIIHPSTPRSPQWSLSHLFPQQDPIHPPLLTHTCHMPSPSHSSRFLSPAQYWVRSTNHLALFT